MTQAEPIIVPPHLPGQLITGVCLTTKSSQSEFFPRTLQLKVETSLFFYLVNYKNMEQDCQWPSTLIHGETVHGIEHREANKEKQGPIEIRTGCRKHCGGTEAPE